MFKKTLKRALSLLVASAVTMSSVTFATTSKAEANMNLDQLIQQLKEVSEDKLPEKVRVTEEENKLNSYEVIDSRIDLKTSEMVNVIVEFKQEPLAIEKLNKNVKSLSSDYLDKEHKEFIKFLQGKESEYSKEYKEKFATIGEEESVELFNVKMEYYEVFNGMAVSIRGNQIESLLESGSVKRIWVDSIISLDNPEIDNELYGENSNEVIKGQANQVPISNVEGNKGEIEPFMHDTIPYLGIDKIHNEGITGKGVKVGVLDTGIDYNHPDLKDVYVGGYDFIDMDNDPMETTYEDWLEAYAKDPTNNPENGPNGSYYTSHGTHVSGTIAGQGKNNVAYAVSGVAPNVELSVYRVLGPYGSGATSGIIAAIEKSVKDGMDVINLSLGANINDPIFPTSVAINNASRAGVVSVVAAGNAGALQDGSTRMYSVGAPGASPLAITVGAGTSDMKLQSIKVASDGTEFEGRILARDFKASIADLKGKSYEVVYAGKGNEADFKNLDLTGKIALIERGDLALYNKAVNAGKKGAEVVIIYNNVEGTIDAYLGEVGDIPLTMSVTKEAGMAIRKAMEAGKKTVSFGDVGEFVIEGGELADFSSRGPIKGTLDIKPDVVATGVNIFSTYPEFINDKDLENDRYDLAYARISGTSMATPHVAGIAALLLERYPDYTPEQIKVLLMNTANPMKGEYSVFEEGAGMVDPYEAIHTDDILQIKDTVKNIENGVLMNIDHYTGSARFPSVYVGEEVDYSKEVSIENKGTTKDVYKVSYEFNYRENGSQILNVRDGKANNITFDLPQTIEVEAGSIKDFNFKPIIPESAQKGLYEGYVYFQNEANPGQSIRVPFAFNYAEKGIAFAMGSHAFSNKARVAGMPKAVGGVFRLNNPMKYVDFVLLDAKTDKPVGYMKRHSGDYLLTGIVYQDTILNRGVYKLTGDPLNPISDEMFIPNDGDYKVAMIAVDEEGESYIVKEDMVIANIPSTVEITNVGKGIKNLTDADFTVEEYDGKEYQAYWIKGKVFDPVIEKLRTMGHKDIKQSQNSVVLFIDGRPAMPIIVEEDGTFKIGIQKEDIEQYKGTMEIGLQIISYSGMGGYNRLETILAYGEPLYGVTIYDNAENVKASDSVVAKSYLRNVKNAESINVRIMYDEYIQDLSDIRVSDELQQIAAENNGEVKFEILSQVPGYAEMEISVRSKADPDKCIPLTGEVPLFEYNQTTKSNQISYFTTYYTITNSDGSKNYEEGYRVNIPILQREEKTYEFPVFVKAEAPLFEYDTIYKNKNKFVKSVATTKDGQEMVAEYDEGTEMFIFKGVTTTEEMKVVSSATGHLTHIQTVQPLALDENGNPLYEPYEEMAQLKAGDINGDNVIDILDLKLVYDKLGTRDENLVEDLTGDGYVDDVDLGFVAKNYLSKNELATKEPLTEVDGMTFERILTEVQQGGIFAALDHPTYTFIPGKDLKIDFNLIDAQFDFTTDRYGMFEVPVYAAYYDEDNRMIGLDSGTVTAVFARINDDLIIKPKEGAKKVKIFLWSGLNGMKVMREYTEFNVEK